MNLYLQYIPKWLLPLVLVIILVFTAYNLKKESSPNISLDQKIGQMFIMGFEGTQVTQESPIAQDIARRHLGGVILYQKKVKKVTGEDGITKLTGITWANIVSPSQLKELTTELQAINSKSSSIPLFIATDQEGGQVARLTLENGFSNTLSHQELGQLDEELKTFEESQKIAKVLKAMGINLNFAPVVDVAINPENTVIFKKGRSFGATPQAVYKHAKAYIKGHKVENILCTLKHFPGHGNTLADSHFGLADASFSWTPQETIPYALLIEDNLVDAIMSAHVYNKNIDPTYPATLSYSTLHEKLRQDLQFKGLIISDDIQMEALSKNFSLREILLHGIHAGIDIFIVGQSLYYEKDYLDQCVIIIKDLIEKGEISEERINASYQRIMSVKSKISPNKK